MWIMVLAVAAFLLIAVPQIEVLIKPENRNAKIIVSQSRDYSCYSFRRLPWTLLR
jgi:hypothetical protein